MTTNIDMGGGNLACNWNDFSVNAFEISKWRASLVPAAAVIPAPLVYISIVVVKTLVV